MYPLHLITFSVTRHTESCLAELQYAVLTSDLNWVSLDEASLCCRNLQDSPGHIVDLYEISNSFNNAEHVLSHYFSHITQSTVQEDKLTPKS